MRLTLSPSLYLSIPPSGSISEWFSSRNTLLRRQLKKSERSKQFSLMPSPLCPPVRSSALRLRRLPLPSSHRSQPTSRELRASSPCNQASRRLLRRGCGGGGQDPEIRSGRCLPRSSGSAARPARVFGRPSPSSSQVWVLVAPPLARSRLRQRLYLCCEEGKRRDGDGLSLPQLTSPRLERRAPPDIDSPCSKVKPKVVCKLQMPDKK